MRGGGEVTAEVAGCRPAVGQVRWRGVLRRGGMATGWRGVEGETWRRETRRQGGVDRGGGGAVGKAVHWGEEGKRECYVALPML